VVVTLSPTLGSVSDRGIVHHQNEDAGTVVDLGAAGAVACVVSDGVSNVEGSQEASAAAVEATAGVLTVAASDAGAEIDGTGWIPALREARRAAAIAAAACTRPGAREAASCTWAAAVTDGTTVWAANVGDSRIYLVGDDGRGRQLGTDHSWAAEAVAQGADPATVMTDRRAHMITAWMGADAPELPDTTAEATVEGPGWLLAVSDGLWNYCEEGDDLAALVVRLGGPTLDATALAEALVGFACAAGGADNVTISAARLTAEPIAAHPIAAEPIAADPEPGA
jgi:serine/threonine protein phosphatase PrpC